MTAHFEHEVKGLQEFSQWREYARALSERDQSRIVLFFDKGKFHAVPSAKAKAQMSSAVCILHIFEKGEKIA